MNHGDGETLAFLAERWEAAGNLVEAERLYGEVLLRGGADALQELARLREMRGDRAGAGNMRRFGVNDDGSPALSLD